MATDPDSAAPATSIAGRGHAFEHAIDVEVLVDIRPVDAVPGGLDPVIPSLRGCGVEQTWIPFERQTDHPPVHERDAHGPIVEGDPIDPLVSDLGRSAHAR